MADAADSKSAARKGMGVQVPSPALPENPRKYAYLLRNNGVVVVAGLFTPNVPCDSLEVVTSRNWCTKSIHPPVFKKSTISGRVQNARQAANSSSRVLTFSNAFDGVQWRSGCDVAAETALPGGRANTAKLLSPRYLIPCAQFRKGCALRECLDDLAIAPDYLLVSA